MPYAAAPLAAPVTYAAAPVTYAAAPPAQQPSGEETLQWLNDFIGSLWPRVDLAVQKIVNEQVVPKVNEKIAAISSMASEVSFDRFTLGQSSPKFGPIRLVQIEDGMKLHLNIDYQSDVDISIRWGPMVTIGVSRLRFSGEMVMKFAPLIDEVPVVGGLGVYFYNCPQIDLDFTGAANVADMPGVNRVLWNTVTGIVSDMMVLPNVLGIPIGDKNQVDHALIKCPEPMGMLRVTAVKANGLRGADWSMFGKATSDPFLQVTVADTMWTSSTINKTVDPEWTEDDRYEFMVFDKEQTVKATVLDSDAVSGNDTLGFTNSLVIRDVLGQSEAPLTLFPKQPKAGQDNGEPCGTLSLRFEWMALEPPYQPGQPVAHDLVVITVKVGEVTMPWETGGDLPAVCLRATMDECVKTTKPGAVPVKKMDAKQAEMLQGIVMRLAAKGVDEGTIAEVTKLNAEEVAAVTAGGTIDEAQFPDPDFKTFPVDGAVYYVTDKETAGADPALTLEVVDKAGKKVIASFATTILTAGAGPIAMEGADGERVDAQVGVTVRGLTVGGA